MQFPRFRNNIKYFIFTTEKTSNCMYYCNLMINWFRTLGKLGWRLQVVLTGNRKTYLGEKNILKHNIIVQLPYNCYTYL